VDVAELTTPALVVDRAALEHNLSTMAAARPGPRLRPHVKAHKCTELARRQVLAGHRGLTCATVREAEGLAAAGLGEDLLVANEVLDARRLGSLVAAGARVTLAVDSAETVAAAAGGGVREVVVDVDVGLPRCGCRVEDAGELAAAARRAGLEVRGVMGYEGHVVGLEDRSVRAEQCATAMALLMQAHAEVGGELVTAGGTGTYDLNTWAGEIQAGSYVLMDHAYGKLQLPFRQALFVLATVISAAEGWCVLDCGLKSLSLDHGNPEVPGSDVWYSSDEHTVLSPPRKVGERVRVVPGHVDPTVALHERMHLVDGEQVVETWAVDLRGW
jgi:D-serine deaminase-like pyridoxal phosphate-dependent protein